MKDFYIRDQLVFYIINSRFMLDALSNWAKKEDIIKPTLDEHLWNTLKDHASAHYSVYCLQLGWVKPPPLGGSFSVH